MLLYVTAEDVFGDAAPEPRGPERRPERPATLSALYDLGMRHHRRSGPLGWPADGGFEVVPDWKLDRLVIRIALCCRERLGLEPGTRAAIFGRLGWLWPAAEFAVQGFGATAVGIEHDVEDGALEALLEEADPRVVFSTDSASTARLLELRRRVGRGAALVAAEAGPAGDGVLPIGEVLDLGGTLDTAERAQSFRLVCRRTAPETEALWHASSRGVERVTHARAMEQVTSRLLSRPPAAGDVVYLRPPRVTLAGRLAVAAFVGDGQTEAVLGSDPGDEAARLRPHGIRASADWLEAACRGCEPRWPAGLDRSRARRRLQAVLGDRLRWIETDRPVDARTAAALAAAGTRVIVVGESAGEEAPTPLH